jgi:DNA polymerase-3 subunit delta
MILELINLLSNSHAKNVIISTSNPDKRTRLFKEVFTKFDTIDIDKALRSNNFKEIVRSFASDQSVKIDDDAIDILYEKCGSNYRIIEQEIHKLSTYVSGGKDKISCDDVKLLVDDYASENFFEPVEAFFNKNIRAFSRSIKRFFFVNSDARPLISALQSRNRLMIQIKTLIISKKLNCQNKFSLKKELEYASKFYHMDNLKKDQFNIFLQNPWYIEKMLNSCQQFTIGQLLKLQISLSDVIKDLSNYHDDQQSILNKIATEFLC